MVGNLHKWCHTPRGCALLYIAMRNQAKMNPIRYSKFHYRNLWYRFTSQGTRDHTPYCCTIAGLDFLEMCGGLVCPVGHVSLMLFVLLQEGITPHNTALRDKAQELIATTWGTPILPVSKELTAPFMSLIKMPDKYDECPQNQDAIDKIQHEIYKEYGILFVLYWHQGRLFCRIGANIYNTIEDYETMAKAVLEWDPRKHGL